MTELFLQKYRVLEGLLEKNYEGRRMSSSSVVIEYLRDEDSKGIRAELDLLREMRNLLTHHALDDGSPVAQPTAGTIELIDSVIAYVSRPKLAIAYGTPVDRIISAHMEDSLRDVARNMSRRGVSIAPVLDDDNVVVGLISIRIVFDYFVRHGRSGVEDMKLGDLGEYLRLDRPRGDNVAFAPLDTPIYRAREMFNEGHERDKRLGLIFITKDGMSTQPLQALLSPWDALKHGPTASGEEIKA